MIRREHGNYTLQRFAEDEIITVASSRYGHWRANSSALAIAPLIHSPAEQMPFGAKEHRLDFTISFKGYFVPENIGHFAFVMRGGLGDSNSDNILDLDGRGIIIGNVSKYPQGLNGKGPTPVPNCLAIESFWAGGNCVYGEVSSSFPMENETTYGVTCIVRDSGAGEKGRIIEVSMVNASTLKYWKHTLFDYNGKSSGNLYGFTILEVFSRHSWTAYINNLNETVK